MKDIYAILLQFTLISVSLPLEKHAFSFIFFNLAFITLTPARWLYAFSVLRLPPFNTVPKKCWPSSNTCSRTKPLPQDLIAAFMNFLLDSRKEPKYWEYLKNFKRKKKRKKEKGGSSREAATNARVGKTEKGLQQKQRKNVSKQTDHSLVVEDDWQLRTNWRGHMHLDLYIASESHIGELQEFLKLPEPSDGVHVLDNPWLTTWWCGSHRGQDIRFKSKLPV